jgi:hypothetical protein
MNRNWFSADGCVEMVGDLEAVGPDVGVSDVVGGAEALSDGLEETVGPIVGVSEIDGCHEVVGTSLGEMEAVGLDDSVTVGASLDVAVGGLVGVLLGAVDVEGLVDGLVDVRSKFVSLGLTEGLKDGLGVGAHVGPRPCRFIFKQSFPVDTGGSWSIKSHCNFLFSLAPRT